MEIIGKIGGKIFPTKKVQTIEEVENKIPKKHINLL